MNLRNTTPAVMKALWRQRYGVDAPMRVKKPAVRVQACRPADRAMLQTPAGQELLEKAVAAMREGKLG